MCVRAFGLCVDSTHQPARHEQASCYLIQNTSASAPGGKLDLLVGNNFAHCAAMPPCVNSTHARPKKKPAEAGSHPIDNRRSARFHIEQLTDQFPNLRFLRVG